MRFFSKERKGFAIDPDLAEALDLLEEYLAWEEEHTCISFCSAFEEKYGVLPEAVKLFDYDEVDTIKDLCGFEWDRSYVLFEDYQEGTADWEKLAEILEEEDVSIDYGNWSEEEN